MASNRGWFQLTVCVHVRACVCECGVLHPVTPSSRLDRSSLIGLQICSEWFSTWFDNMIKLNKELLLSLTYWPINRWGTDRILWINRLQCSNLLEIKEMFNPLVVVVDLWKLICNWLMRLHRMSNTTKYFIYLMIYFVRNGCLCVCVRVCVCVCVCFCGCNVPCVWGYC